MDLPCSAKFLKRVSRLPLTVISDASVAIQKSVLKELCCYANEKGICWPSIETLSEGESRAPRTVYRALRALEDQDYIERVSYAGRGKSTRRRINVKKIVADTQKGDTSGMDYGEEKGDTESQKGDSSALKGDSSAQKGATNGPQKNHTEEPVEESEEEPISSPAARAASSEPSFPEEEPNAWGLVRVTDPVEAERLSRELDAAEEKLYAGEGKPEEDSNTPFTHEP